MIVLTESFCKTGHSPLLIIAPAAQLKKTASGGSPQLMASRQGVDCRAIVPSPLAATGHHVDLAVLGENGSNCGNSQVHNAPIYYYGSAAREVIAPTIELGMVPWVEFVSPGIDLLRRICFVALERVVREFEARVEREFVEDVMDVAFDGVDGNKQLIGNLLVALPLGNQFDHILLTFGHAN